jgi:redox-sensitive bicupin YhaK (pirin superfamily)
MHGHRDMEIVTYVRRGAITHRDHLGNVGRTASGDVQVMSAGHGVQHAEHNEEDEPCELFQIWIAPRRRGSEPRWEQRAFSKDEYGTFLPLASGGAEHAGALFIDADATLFGLRLRAGERAVLPLRPGRIAYGVAVEGRGAVNELPFDARDGFAVEFEDYVDVRAEATLELCLLELPGPSTAWNRPPPR